SLPAPPGLQFSAYARDLQHRLEGPSGAAAKAHWLDSLAGELPVLDLPTDRPRPAFKTYTGGQRGIELDAAALAAIKEYAGERGATPFALLLAAYAVWLKRLCSTDDVVIGVAMAGQPAAGSRDLVGHCVSLYPLRSRASPSEPFGRHAAEMQSALLDSLDHADCTYGSLLAELALPRDPGRLPLLSTLVTYETETQGLGFGDLALQVEAAPKGYCNFDLELYLTETAAGLRVEFHYNADLFESTTIDRWLENYATLLDSLQRAGATAPAATLDMFGARERALLQAWNATAAPFPREIGVHDLVTRQAARTPDAVAVVTPASAEGGDSATLRYAEVETRACRLAQLLLQRGVAVGDRVALCMPRTAELLVAILAIWKAGACYVPLDPDYPRARLAHTLADSSARLVVTDSSVWPGVHDAGVEVCALDREAAALAALEPRDPQLGVGGEALAYVLYTSGSTGKPKGVQVPHRAVSNLLAALTRVPGLDASDCWLAVATVAFDVSVAELWLPLVVGAQVVLASSVDAQDGTRLSHLLDAHGVTVMQATPATWRLLLEGGWAGRDALRIVSAGEALSVELARELTARSREVWNLYGPTETTVYSTGTAVPRAPDRITIGRPIANTRAHVLDAQGIPVPIGAVGELVLAGEGVTLGYLGRDDLTAERFVPDPDATGQRRYRTGDLVRWRADGELEFLGRGDQQVKLRGFRIELGEIESVLVQQPGVRAAAVARREDVPGDQRLVAYVVAEGSSEPAVAALRQGLRDHLPEYMVPATYVVLDALPLTPNRKLDRAALPAPDGEAALSSRHEQVPPRTDTERALAEIWADVLGHAAVGTNENFFDLGGYSLLAARVLSRCRVRFPVAVSLRQLFMAPTVAQLAAVIDAMRSQDATASDDAPDARFEIEL
ncbi:MAG: amino acid adenylation domain-containing protein, partial [Planctomycetota bacterium]